MDDKLHIKYFERHLVYPLPEQYISLESQRISLGYFCIGGLSLLNKDNNKLIKENKKDWIKWIYSLEDVFNTGGFYGSPSQNYTNIASTFFAISTLSMLDDPLEKLHVDKLMDFLINCQTSNGMFCPSIQGGEDDLRYTYCAIAIRYMIPIKYPAKNDINLLDTQNYIKSCQNYDGGMGNGPYQESHAGLTFCGIAALGLIDLIMGNTSGVVDRDAAIKYLTSLQSDNGGFCGRPNKPCDSCYSLWSSNALKILSPFNQLWNQKLNCKFLISNTQCRLTGGFSKLPSDNNNNNTPDPLHSYLSICAIRSNQIDPFFVIPK